MFNEILLLNESDNPDPFKQTEGSVGLDLYAKEEITVRPFQPTLIGTGIRVVIPRTMEGQIRMRSSLALKGLFIPNSPGTIDSDYRGEIKVIMSSTSAEDIILSKGERVAQLVPCQVPLAEVRTVSSEEFYKKENSSERGSQGFGSTGFYI